MDSQHNYEISLKKDELFINLSSDDVYFISKQMDKWFRILLDDSYVPVTLPQRPQPAPTPVTPAESTVPPVAPPPVEAPPPVVSLPEPPAVAPVIASPAPAVVQAAPPAVAAAIEPEEPAHVSLPEPEPVIAPVATVQESVSAPQPMPETVAPVIPAPAPEIPIAPVLSVVPSPPAPTPESFPKDDFEAVMNTVMKDLEAPPSPAPVLPKAEPELPEMEVDDAPAATGRMNLSIVNSLADLCEQAHAGSAEDYLLLAAYYLSQIENQTAFSLKRINANLVKSGLTPVNHSVLEAVLTKGLLTMVPDLTGTAEVSEYSISPAGIGNVNQLF